ncbi:rRNA maturation RNase YbeY [Kamptonema cortianum]|nr:rRNA maturation RNase YbeY [Kamptonema cortianum]
MSEDFSQREVSVVLTTDEEVHTLNKTFRHQDKATNVLSFPSDEKPELGDIILAYETVLKEAKELGISTLHHTLHLIIHGFLHLLGYDHEADHEAEEMESLEIQILKTLNIQNPYEDK